MCEVYIPTGQSWQEKVENVRKKMSKVKASLLVVTALDEVACKYSLCPYYFKLQ